MGKQEAHLVQQPMADHSSSNAAEGGGGVHSESGGFQHRPDGPGYHWLLCSQYGPEHCDLHCVRVVRRGGSLLVMRDNGHHIHLKARVFDHALWLRTQPGRTLDSISTHTDDTTSWPDGNR